MHPTRCNCDGLARLAGFATNQFPQTAEEDEKAEDALATELAHMSVLEQESILFDLHGIAEGYEQDQATIEKLLKELDHELDMIAFKSAYDAALQKNPEYVRNPDFLLSFVHMTRLHVPYAAEVLSFHFENKRRLFGDGEVLARDIRQSDLTLEERTLLYQGMIQIMPHCDVTGRPVIVLNTSFMHQCNIPARKLMRPFVYLRSRALDQMDAHKRGSVWVAYSTQDAVVELQYILKLFTETCSIVPQFLAAAHFCGSTPNLKQAVKGYQLHAPKHARHRVRPHVGTLSEIFFELQTYGIKTQEGPMNEDGTWSTSFHQEWLRALKAEEEAMEAVASSSGSIVPQRFDILLGRHKRSLDHTGNRRLAHLCEMHYSEYTQAPRSKKTEMADRLVSMTHQSGGRFLEWDDTDKCWILAKEGAARNKVAHNFRYLRSKLQKQQEAAGSGASTDGTKDTDECSSSEGSRTGSPVDVTLSSTIPTSTTTNKRVNSNNAEYCRVVAEATSQDGTEGDGTGHKRPRPPCTSD